MSCQRPDKPPLICRLNEYDMVGTRVKSDLSVDTKGSCFGFFVSPLLSLNFMEMSMLTVDVNFIRPNKGILIPPGEENEYLEVTAIVLRLDLDSD